MNKGILNILIASVFFSIINALVKYLSTIPALEIVFFRSIVSFLICFYTIKAQKLVVFNKFTPLLLGRGLSGAISLSLFFYIIQRMPLATAVTLLYLAPIFTIILAIFMTKEKPQLLQWPFIFIAFIGTVLMKNVDARVESIDFILGLVAALFAGLAYNFIRLLKDKVSTSVIIFYFPLVTLPIVSPYVFLHWVTPNFVEFFLLIAIGILTQLAQVFMTRAYTLEAASKISHFNYLTSFYAFLTGIIFFDEHLNFISITGLFLVFIGIIFCSKFSK